MGQLYPTSVLSDQGPQPDPTEPLQGVEANPRLACTYSQPITATTSGNLPTSSRMQRLLEILHLDSSVLSTHKVKCLQDFIVQHEDVFALDNSELGITDLVTYSIDTGDQPPIRQPVRRTLFTLRS